MYCLIVSDEDHFVNHENKQTMSDIKDITIYVV